MTNLRGRLSFANVVSVIALFVALGGTGLAASQLGKNSVGTKQLKKNAITTAKIKKEAVTAAKVKKGTLTGTQINASTLGTVPTAQAAQTAETANAVAASEAWHVVGAPGEPQFQHGCEANTEKGQAPVGFYKDREGLVHLEGLYVECASEGQIAFQLPAGYRPGALQQFQAAGALAGHLLAVLPGTGPGVDESKAGGVSCANEYCLLNGITFRAES